MTNDRRCKWCTILSNNLFFFQGIKQNIRNDKIVLTNCRIVIALKKYWIIEDTNFYKKIYRITKYNIYQRNQRRSYIQIIKSNEIPRVGLKMIMISYNIEHI